MRDWNIRHSQNASKAANKNTLKVANPKNTSIAANLQKKTKTSKFKRKQPISMKNTKNFTK